MRDRIKSCHGTQRMLNERKLSRIVQNWMQMRIKYGEISYFFSLENDSHSLFLVDESMNCSCLSLHIVPHGISLPHTNVYTSVTPPKIRDVCITESALVYSQLVQSSVHRSQSIASEVDQPHHFHWPLDSFRLSHFNHFNLANALTSHNPHWIDSKMISQWKHRKRRSPTTAIQSYTEQMTIALLLGMGCDDNVTVGLRFNFDLIAIISKQNRREMVEKHANSNHSHAIAVWRRRLSVFVHIKYTKIFFFGGTRTR